MIEDSTFSVLGDKPLLDLGFLSIVTRQIQGPTGVPFDRTVVAHPGAVAVVPLIGDDVVLIKQYRAAAKDHVLEIPAGKLDVAGEDIQEAAKRELAEETGFVAGALVHLSHVWTAIGFSDERIHIFLAHHVDEGPSTPVGPEESDASVIRLPLTQALSMIDAGDISDSKTVIGLLLAARRRDPS